MVMTYLVGEPLLLEVETRSPELGARVEKGRPRPGCESALHCDGCNGTEMWIEKFRSSSSAPRLQTNAINGKERDGDVLRGGEDEEVKVDDADAPKKLSCSREKPPECLARAWGPCSLQTDFHPRLFPQPLPSFRTIRLTMSRHFC